MKELIRRLGQYINNNNDKLVELIYYILCRIEYGVKFKIKLKLRILLLALVFVMFGCEPKAKNGYKVGTRIYYVTTIDDCEYIRSGSHFAHKGNCKYCAERRKKEQEELIQILKEK